ncbi:hypothetical protein E2C01_018132 [Portunus trituberculatus]|uniref:Uncharacterized protein n=1 Tax=Portunus trituberculatus TaxID=210409 RepID=A0A5B7DUP4_PORTR|nr:hypothetical protein [Portunus trituberculatus]
MQRLCREHITIGHHSKAQCKGLKGLCPGPLATLGGGGGSGGVGLWSPYRHPPQISQNLVLPSGKKRGPDRVLNTTNDDLLHLTDVGHCHRLPAAIPAVLHCLSAARRCRQHCSTHPRQLDLHRLLIHFDSTQDSGSLTLIIHSCSVTFLQ